MVHVGEEHFKTNGLWIMYCFSAVFEVRTLKCPYSAMNARNSLIKNKFL